MKLKINSTSMRLVEKKDAEFILNLRLNGKYNKYLSKVDNNLESQINWIAEYKISESNKEQFYFIIENENGVPCGTVRIYDLKKDSFCWGSWILNENKKRYSAIESALLVYDFGFEELGYEKSHFDVMKENNGVVKFHKRFGAEVVNEDDDNYYFEIDKKSVLKSKKTLMELICKK